MHNGNEALACRTGGWSEKPGHNFRRNADRAHDALPLIEKPAFSAHWRPIGALHAAEADAIGLRSQLG